jgi:glycerol kinase
LIGEPSDLDRFVGADAGGVICVSALAGLAAPWWRADATATFTGITLATRPKHLVVALVQGIAAQVAELTDVITPDLGQPLRSLRVDGGLTRSRLLMQSVADLTQLPVGLYPSADATALGAAALGRMAQDPSLAIRDAVLDWQSHETYEPEWDAKTARAFRERWTAAAIANLPATPDR